MNKNYSIIIILRAISAVGGLLACGLGGVCLFGYISDELRELQRKQDAEWFAIRRLREDVSELELKLKLLQEKK